MHWAASALATRLMLERYLTSVAFDENGSTIRLASRLPGTIRDRFLVPARLRAYPSGVNADQVTHCAPAEEIVLHVLNQIPRLRRQQRAWLDVRHRSFDRAVSRKVCSEDQVFFGSFNASLRSLERVKELGGKSILNYPIAHHDWSRRLLTEEAKLQPEFAPTLQFPGGTSKKNRARLDLELQYADRILAFSGFHASTFIDEGIAPDKFVVAPLGVDAQLFRPCREDRDRSKFRVIFVGQIGQRKGLSYLIEGFRQAAIPRSELLLVGAVIGTDVAWRDIPGVRHVPHVPRHDLPALYATASVFVMPSLVEGFCQTPLEALACGVPVIVTPNTFGEDVVRDGVEGWNVPIRDADAIAEKLRHVASDGELSAQMSVAARLRAESYSWDSFGSKICEQLLTVSEMK